MHDPLRFDLLGFKIVIVKPHTHVLQVTSRYRLLSPHPPLRPTSFSTQPHVYNPVPAQCTETQHDRQHRFALLGFNVPSETAVEVNMETKLDSSCPRCLGAR